MSKEKQIRQVNIITYTLMALAFVAVFIVPIIPQAYADIELGTGNETQLAWAKQIMTGPLNVVVDTITTDSGELSLLWEKCTGSLSDIGMEAAYNSLKVLGGLIALAIAMAHILDRLQKEADTMEAITRGLMEFFITALIIMNAGDIMDKLGAAGTEIVRYFSPGSVDNIDSMGAEELLAALCNGKSDGGAFWRMEASIKLIIPWVLSMLISVATKFAIIQIMLEIVIRKIFAPIAIADIYHEGLRSPGMRYIKRYFGAYLKMAVCAAVCLVVPNFMRISAPSGGAQATFDYMFAIIAVNFAAVAFMFKAGEYTNDIVGA